MGRARLQTTVDEDLLNWFKLEWCPKHGKSNLSECLELAFQILKQQDIPVDEQPPEWKRIVLKYDAACLFCGKQLKKGDNAFWAKGVGVICPDCYVKRQIESLSDKTLIKKYVTKLELEKTISALRNELKALSELYSLSEKAKAIDSLLKTLEDINNTLIQAKSILMDSQDIAAYFKNIDRKLDELTPVLMELKNKLYDIEYMVKNLGEGRSRTIKRAREILKEYRSRKR